MKNLKDFRAAANEYSRTEGFPQVTGINYSIEDANTAGAYMKLALSGLGHKFTRKQLVRRAYQFWKEKKTMIHPIYNKPELARRYYKEKTGEDLENELARKRFWADKKINKKILLKVLRQAIKEQIGEITTYNLKKPKADSPQ